MKKNELKQQIKEALNEVLSDIKKVSSEEFYAKKNDKWSAAENLAHLSLSAKLFLRALRAPKYILAYKFGLKFGHQRNLKWLDEFYKATTIPARTGFEPRMSPETTLEFEKQAFINNHQLLIEELDKWAEWQLSLFQLPQLVYGKLSVRETCIFISYHIRHHEKAIRIALTKKVPQS